jgi:hypothetical protein
MKKDDQQKADQSEPLHLNTRSDQAPISDEKRVSYSPRELSLAEREAWVASFKRGERLNTFVAFALVSSILGAGILIGAALVYCFLK